MTTDTRHPAPARPVPPWKIIVLVLVTVALSVGTTLWLVFTLFFPTEFQPVTLNQKEERVLEQKLERLEPGAERSAGGRLATPDGEPTLTPEPYSEEGASREIVLSERELNALLARNTDLAHRVAIDLSEDLASAKVLVPLDPQLPILGGKTLKVTAGMEMRYAGGRPVIILKGVSVWGVPVPNAWLGNLKNIDLVQEFGTGRGFWQGFAEGVEQIEVAEGQLRIRLRE